MQRPAFQVDFLLWLDRYVGTWDDDGQAYTIRRRNDGWLEARGPDYKVASLKELLARGKRVKPAQSPLGMYPVLLSQPLMELWLKPDEMNRLRNAGRVGYGMRLLVKTIERNIRESDDATRRAKFETMWLLGRSYNERWTKDDAEVYGMLLAECEADTSRQAQQPRMGRGTLVRLGPGRMAAKAQQTRSYRRLPPFLRALREEAGLTQRELGKRMKKPQSWVYNLQDGKPPR